MSLIIIQPPLRFEEIVKIIKQSNWLFSAFDADEYNFFNPANYHYNNKVNNIEYKILLDTNIFNYIVSAVKKNKNKKEHRAALALIAFCQVADICLDPSMAVYESIFARNGNADEAVEDLLLFYRIDNSSTESLMNYALNASQTILLSEPTGHNKKDLMDQLTRYKWLTEWKSLYLIILNIVHCHNAFGDKYEQFANLVKWIVKEFRLSFICILYALYLYTSLRVKNMLKYKKISPRHEQIAQLNNMTWDLFIINRFFRELTDNNSNSEIIFASDDKVVKELISASIDIQRSGDFKVIKNKLLPSERQLVDLIDSTLENTQVRAYDSPHWSPEYREELIEKSEALVLNSA